MILLSEQTWGRGRDSAQGRPARPRRNTLGRRPTPRHADSTSVALLLEHALTTVPILYVASESRKNPIEIDGRSEGEGLPGVDYIAAGVAGLLAVGPYRRENDSENPGAGKVRASSVPI